MHPMSSRAEIDRESSKRVRLVPRAKGSGYQPQLATLNASTFADLMEQKKEILIPRRCIGQETLPAATLDRWHNYPPDNQRSLPTFANAF